MTTTVRALFLLLLPLSTTVGQTTPDPGVGSTPPPATPPPVAPAQTKLPAQGPPPTFKEGEHWKPEGAKDIPSGSIAVIIIVPLLMSSLLGGCAYFSIRRAQSLGVWTSSRGGMAGLGVNALPRQSNWDPLKQGSRHLSPAKGSPGRPVMGSPHGFNRFHSPRLGDGPKFGRFGNTSPSFSYTFSQLRASDPLLSASHPSDVSPSRQGSPVRAGPSSGYQPPGVYSGSGFNASPVGRGKGGKGPAEVWSSPYSSPNSRTGKGGKGGKGVDAETCETYGSPTRNAPPPIAT